MNLATLAERGRDAFGTFDFLIFEGKHYSNEDMVRLSRQSANAMRTSGLKSSDDLFVHEPSQGSWITKSPAPTKRDHLAAAALGALFYVGGGREKSLAKSLAVLEFYDSRADTWGTGPLLPTARGGVAGAAFDGLFVVLGGEQPGGTFGEVEAFEPLPNRWLALPPLPTPRHGLAAAVVGNTLYAIGGGKRPGLSVTGINEALEIR